MESLGQRINFREKQDKGFHLADDMRVGVYVCAVTHRHNSAPRNDDPANFLLFSGNLKTVDGRSKQIKPSSVSFSFPNVNCDVQY